MPEFNFKEKRAKGYFTYHLKGTREGFINDAFYGKYIEEIKDENFIVWLYKQGITYSGSMEDTILYAILLNLLMGNQSCLLTYFGNETEIKYIRDDLFSDRIEWRYSIEFGTGLEVCEDFGFLNPYEFLEVVNYFNKDLSHRYYYLSELIKSDLKNYMRIFHSDVSNWNFIFCSKNKVNTIKDVLSNKAEKPEINSLLENCEMMINLQVGEDEGYLDYVLIHSKIPIKEKLSQIETRINQFILDYEHLLMNFERMDIDLREDTFIQEFEAILNNAINELK